MVPLGLVILLLAVHGVQPSEFAHDAKPLELRRLGNEYCEYGLRRHPPHKWCICWGKIDTRIEVLPWDCETRAPKFLSRRKRDRGLDDFLRSIHARDDFLRSLNTKNHLVPQDLLKADPKWETPRWRKPEQPKPSVLEKALTVMFKQMAESNSDRTSSMLAAKLLLLPYLQSNKDSADGNPSLFSQAMSALKLLLHDLGDAQTVEGLEASLFKDLMLLKLKYLTVKHAVIADLEGLLHILKDFPATNQSHATPRDPGNVNPKGHLWDLFRKDQNASADHQKTLGLSQPSKLELEPRDASPGKVPPASDQMGLILKLGGAGNYSFMSEMLGKFIAEAIGLDVRPKIVPELESPPKSSVCITESQDPTTQITKKCSTEPEIQAPANLTQSSPAVSNSSEKSPREVTGNSSESSKLSADGFSTQSPKNAPSKDLKLEENSSDTFALGMKNYQPKPDSGRYLD